MFPLISPHDIIGFGNHESYINLLATFNDNHEIIESIPLNYRKIHILVLATVSFEGVLLRNTEAFVKLFAPSLTDFWGILRIFLYDCINVAFYYLNDEIVL